MGVAEKFADAQSEVRVLHHPRYFVLGQAFKSGFDVSRGKYVVVLACDLSYSPDHIQKLLDRIRLSEAKVDVASPYAKGGKVSYVHWLRRVMSVWANRFLPAWLDAVSPP